MTSQPPDNATPADPMRQAGFQRIETIYTTENGAFHTRTDWIRVTDFPRLKALLDELRI